MPPFIVLAAAGVGLYAGYRLLSKLVTQAQTPSPSEVERRKRETAAATGNPKDLGELEWDEKAGAYKPRQRQG
jgi:hypothetical protein